MFLVVQTAMQYWIGAALVGLLPALVHAQTLAAASVMTESSLTSVDVGIFTISPTEVMQTETINATMSFPNQTATPMVNVSTTLAFNSSSSAISNATLVYPTVSQTSIVVSSSYAPTHVPTTLPNTGKPREKGSGRKFDTASFIGGMLLVLGLVVIVLVVRKYWKGRPSYNTL